MSNVGMMTVASGTTTNVEVRSMTPSADVKYVEVLNYVRSLGGIVSRILWVVGRNVSGIGRISGGLVAGAGGVGAVYTVSMTGLILEIAIMVYAEVIGGDCCTAPRAVIRLTALGVVGSHYIGRLVHAVIIDIFFVARNKTNCGNKQGHCYQT